LGISAGAALFGIVQPGWATANNTEQWGKKYKDLTISERKDMRIRLISMAVTMVGFLVGSLACG